ncbi:MAG: MoaD/ThiS family protein [Candidatus Thorarchaeota archaeon]
MALLIKLYGDLRKNIDHLPRYHRETNTLKIEINNIKNVLDILHKLSINKEEISHIFVNNKYSKLEKEVKNGDRVGIFPKRMAILFIEIKDPF